MNDITIANPGTKFDIVAFANDGYKFVGYMNNDTLVHTSTTYYGSRYVSYTVPLNSDSINITLEADEAYSVSSTDPDEIISISFAESSYCEGEKVNFSIDAVTGYKISSIDCNVEDLEINYNTGTGSFIMPGQNVVLMPTYEELSSNVKHSISFAFPDDEDFEAIDNSYNDVSNTTLNEGERLNVNITNNEYSGFYLYITIGESVYFSEYIEGNEEEGIFEKFISLVVTDDIHIYVASTEEKVLSLL